MKPKEFLILLHLTFEHTSFLCDKMGRKYKTLNASFQDSDGCLKGKKVLVKLFELATFSKGHNLSLKEQVAHYAYSNLSIWQTLLSNE